MAKTSPNFPKDSCPISDLRRSLSLEYLNEKRNLEVTEFWAEAFEKAAEKTFQIPYWRSFLNASLPSTDASEVSEAIGVTLKSQSKISVNSKRRGYGILFPIQNTFIVPQLPKNSTLLVMTKDQVKALLEDPDYQANTLYFYNFVADLYNSTDKYLPWVGTSEREQMEAKVKALVRQLDAQENETAKSSAGFVCLFKNCGLFVIDDKEFTEDIDRINDYAAQEWQTAVEFQNDTKNLPLYGALWKKPRGAEWKRLLHTTHGIMQMASSSSSSRTSYKGIVKNGIFSERQLEKALAFLKSQYNPEWKSVLASPHDGLCEELIPTFWKRTKLFNEYLTWTDILWKRVINGQAYNRRLELTENFPNMSQFSHCVFFTNADVSSYSSYSKMSCKIPYKFPRPVLMTGYSEIRSYDLKVSGTSANNALPGHVYRLPIGSTPWGPEDELIAGSYDIINDQLTSSMLKTCEDTEVKYKRAMLVITRAFRTVINTEQDDIKEHILDMLSDYELNEYCLSRDEFQSLY